MNHVYPYLKNKAVLLTAVCATVLGSVSFAQTSPCGNVAEPFNTNMGGFQSSTVFSSGPGFVYGNAGGDGALQRCSISSGGTVYQIVSPTYQSLASQTAIGYGFELSGAVGVQRVVVLLQYTDNTGNVNTVEVENFSPSYSGPAPTGVATVCKSVATNSYVGLSSGESYRFIFQITAQSPSNASQCIIFDDFRTTGVNALAPLPVTFTGIYARKAGAGTELFWNVAGEKDVTRYEVEKSTNGREFSKIGDVTANGSTGYSFTDNNAGGVSFYRVRNVDVDGKFKYTKVIRVNNSKSITIRAYPQPATSEVTIEHASVATKGTLTITGADGQRLRTIDVKPDATQTTLNLANLRAGMYLVRFENGLGDVETVKVIKQ